MHVETEWASTAIEASCLTFVLVNSLASTVSLLAAVALPTVSTILHLHHDGVVAPTPVHTSSRAPSRSPGPAGRRLRAGDVAGVLLLSVP